MIAKLHGYEFWILLFRKHSRTIKSSPVYALSSCAITSSKITTYRDFNLAYLLFALVLTRTLYHKSSNYSMKTWSLIVQWLAWLAYTTFTSAQFHKVLTCTWTYINIHLHNNPSNCLRYIIISINPLRSWRSEIIKITNLGDCRFQYRKNNEAVWLTSFQILMSKILLYGVSTTKSKLCLVRELLTQNHLKQAVHEKHLNKILPLNKYIIWLKIKKMLEYLEEAERDLRLQSIINDINHANETNTRFTTIVPLCQRTLGRMWRAMAECVDPRAVQNVKSSTPNSTRLLWRLALQRHHRQPSISIKCSPTSLVNT